VIIEPSKKAMYSFASLGISDYLVPTKAVFCYFTDSVFALRTDNTYPIQYTPNTYFLKKAYRNSEILLVCPPMGSYSGIILEEIISLGVEEIILLGGVGALDEDVEYGDIIVCNKAFCDEGVSALYGNVAGESYPNMYLTNAIKSSLLNFNLASRYGGIWTISNYYRVSVNRRHEMLSLGCLGIDMEAFSLFSICAYREVSIGGVFIACDSLSKGIWTPEKSSSNRALQDDLLKMAIETLDRIT